MDLFDFDATSRSVETANYKLHYHEAGEGPTLIMLHGSGPGVSGWSNFKGNFPVLAEHFRTIILDMPGFGLSSKPNYSKSYPQHAADAAAEFMDALSIPSAHFLGNSMGGFVASELVLEHPDRVDRLVMMGPGGLFVPVTSPDRSEGSKAMAEFMMNPTRENMVGWVDTMVSNTDVVSDELIDERLANALKPGALESAGEVFGSLAQFPRPVPLFALVHLIEHPTLITWGRDDRMLPIDGALLAARRMPNAELHTFPNCGHWAQVERKHEFERLVIEFLTR
jgi:4,5:9,10-diseco-3-hydroxy-5,9,17-trioxoandrosta-1(10),2-diene-4-oate hydrolase